MSKSQQDGKLMGWKEIAAHLKISARTAQEYERERGLPIRRQGDQKKSRIFAYEVELDAWMASKLATRDSTDSASEAVEEQSSSAYELGLEALPPDQPDNINSPTRRQWLKRTAFGVGAGLGLSGLLIALDPIIWKSHTSDSRANRWRERGRLWSQRQGNLATRVSSEVGRKLL